MLDSIQSLDDSMYFQFHANIACRQALRQAVLLQQEQVTSTGQSACRLVHALPSHKKSMDPVKEFELKAKDVRGLI